MVALKLTDDQFDWLLLTVDYELQQEIHQIKKSSRPDMQRRHVAFVRRIRDRLAHAKTNVTN